MDLEDSSSHTDLGALWSPVGLGNCLDCRLGNSSAPPPFQLRGLYLPHLLRILPCLFYQEPFSPLSVILNSDDISSETPYFFVAIRL